MVTRVYLLVLFVSVSWSSLSLAQEATPQTTGRTRPNIIVILADDMGFSDLGCYGGEIAHAEPRRPRRRRAAVHPVLQHRPLLPDAGPACSPGSTRTRPASGT